MKKMLTSSAVCFAMATSLVARAQTLQFAPFLLLAAFSLLASMTASAQTTIAISSYAVFSGSSLPCVFMDDGGDGNSGGALQVYQPYVANEQSQVFNWVENGSANSWRIQNATSGLYLYDSGGSIKTETQAGDYFQIANPNSNYTAGNILDLSTNDYLKEPSDTDGATIPTTSSASSAGLWYFSTSGSSTSSPGCSGGGTTTIDDFDASIIYALYNPANGDGGWLSGSGISVDYDGTEHSANYHDTSTSGGNTFTGVSASVNFTGTGITWIGKMGPNYGVATYAIDGGTPFSFDAYHSSELDQNANVSIPNANISALANGSHVLTISVTNQKNSASSNYWQTIDAFQIQGSPLDLSQGTVVTPCTTPSLLEYAVGNWQGGCNPTGGDGSDGPAPAGHIYSGSNTSYIQWTFTGSLIEVIGRPDFEDGEMLVSIDGGTPKTVDLQAGSGDNDAFNNMVIFAAKVASGTHTIKITPTGTGAASTEPYEYVQIAELIAFQ